ncbi:MAG TPA: hypothetical protein VNO32_10465 [Candidatus Acidoferrum sp.]|jgi:hypothetical protein|nr:hypothetical protein [Candidatus Acidoferrum sp.]
MFRPIFAVVFGIAIAMPSFAAQPQKPDGAQDKDKNFDVRSSAGDLHLGSDADARKAGLPLYPGARLRHDEENSDAVNVGVLTEAFGLKLVVAKYDSDDAPDKVISYYRERLKKYGKVVECHTREHGGDSHADFDDDKHSKELKCEGDNTGPVTELKVGTEDNQHVVAIEPRDGKSGSTFALVYVHTRGKQGDI